MARPLCRVQPDLRPRHPVRAQDRRQCRRDNDEPAAAGDLVVSTGLVAVAPGHVAAVVTFLEMYERPRPAPEPDSELRLERWPAVDPDRYRALFRRVGAQWLWFSRLAMDDAALTASVAEVHAVLDQAGSEVGLVELDFREPGE